MKIFVPSQCELFIVPKVKGAHSCHQSALALFYSLAIEKRKIIVKYCQFKYNYINTNHTISSFPNFHECWYNCISTWKNILFFVYISTKKYKFSVLILSSINTALSQSAFGIYKCYIKIMFMILLWVYIHFGQAEKLAWPRWELCLFMNWYPKSRGFGSHRGQANFSARPMWIYTQSNIINIIFTWVHNIKTHTKNI